MARPMIDSGRLVALSTRRLSAGFSHHLVYPPRSERHPALTTFRTWLLAAAQSYARPPPTPPRRKPRRRAR